MNATTSGQVCWFEFVTPDASAVEKFYGRLLGWTFEPRPHTDDLLIFAPAATSPMGAIVGNRTGGEYLRIAIASADVDDDIARLSRLGATIVSTPTAGTAELADPRGNLFTLVPVPDGAAPGGFSPARGSMAWFEIGSAAPDAATDFYTEAFGWRFEFDANAGGRQYYNIFTGLQWPSGGMYDLRPDGPEYLIPSFLVGDVPALTETAERYGAVVEFGPDGTPDGLKYVRLIDPSGNRFELFSNPGM
ncbi:VOC family protein [Nocardia sp. NPDC127526]|uniref:VOC family protein n=1 Tax=Nocardia sp. NPDC127526 TaxID=3345393 RepID=UPI0036322FCD